MMRKPDRYDIIIIVLVVILAVFLILRSFFSRREPSPPLPVDNTATEWTGVKEIPKEEAAVRQIAIPGIRAMHFKANETMQETNIYNPKENECLIRFHLFCDGTEIWRSGYCSPGNGYYVIEIDSPLTDGIHQGNLVYECARPDGTKLNGANVAFDIVVE